MSQATARQTVVPLRAVHDSEHDRSDDLVRAAQRGDLEAWALLYRMHYAAVVRHLCGLVGSREQAEDLAQDTFARAMTAIGSFSWRSSFSTWLHGVALNVVRNHWRAAQRRAKGKERLHLHEASQQLRDGELDRAHQRHLRLKVLYGVLDELSEALREAFVLRYIEGMSAAEAAEHLGIESGALRVRAHRARQHVEARLEQLKRGSMGGPTGGAS